MFVLIAVSTFVSEDLTCVAAGSLSASGRLNLATAVAACFTGIFIGDILLVLAGRAARSSPWLRSLIDKFVSAPAMAYAAGWLERRGDFAVIISRFVPGTRLPLYAAIGFTTKRPQRFMLSFAIAAALWTPLVVGAAYFIGENTLKIFAQYQYAAVIAVLVTLAGFFVFRKFIQPIFTWRGRHLMRSRWIRLTHWEFWPPYVFYFPLSFYFIYLMIRFRSATVFTAANPAIPDGGVIGESKSAILRGLRGNGRFIPRFALLSVGEAAVRIQQAEKFMRRYRLHYPIVLKPDVGERGHDVMIARGRGDLCDYLETHAAATIIQQFVPGREYGVFYFRFPDAATGHIFAITDKRFPVLSGDGKSTLEELILRDKRALCMAKFHLKKYAARLNEVISAQKLFPLVEIGTHCRGSLFLDGHKLITPGLTRTIDKISRGFNGFYFGRYDIRVASEEQFRRGRGIQIVELNGVTSEATSIYDPIHSLWHAYRVLAKQWRLAFEIGAANARRGFNATPPWTLIKRLCSAAVHS